MNKLALHRNIATHLSPYMKIELKNDDNEVLYYNVIF